jgi:hypothetical protein
MEVTREQISMLESMVIPVIKELLYKLVDHLDRKDLYPTIDTMCDITELGSLKISYTINNEPYTTYIVLKICNKNHDLTAEFNKLSPYVSEIQWKQVLQTLSTVVLLVRTIYSKLYDNLGINDVQYSCLYVDPINTTLGIDGIDERIGIFIDDCSDMV